MQIHKVMLVDDDADLRRICNLTLANIGRWEVVLAGSGLEALEKAEQEKPDVILLDVSMPEMDGVTTLSKIRDIANLKSTPVVLMTAELKPEEKEKCDHLGFSGLISKPINAMELPHELERLLAKL